MSNHSFASCSKSVEKRFYDDGITHLQWGKRCSSVKVVEVGFSKSSSANSGPWLL